MSDKRPNIVYCITDRRRYDTIGALGFPYMDTPNLDRLAREGCVFSRCYAAGLSCAPSRAAIFTGYYPHTTGILKNACEWKHSWLENMADAGYHNVNIGKMHTWPHDTPCGFHQRYNVENKDRYLEGRYYLDEWDRALAANGLVKQQRETYRLRDDYKERLGAFEWELPEKLHSDMFVGGMAEWWLKTYPKTEPLFLQVGFPGPHPPYDPTPRYAEPYMKKDLPIDPVLPEDLESLPPPLKEYRKHCTEVDHDSVAHQFDPDDEGRFRQRAYYLANMTMIDDKVGEIMKSLEEEGYLDNTIVVFTSDHGDCLGDHGLSQKWSSYEQIVRAPTIVWGPGIVKAGHTVDALCQHFDISHALLELAGVDVPKTFESISALPALRGEEWAGRDYVFAEQSGDGNLTDAEMVTMVRSHDWKLTHYSGADHGQLFDMKKDPGEVKNLWDDPDSASMKREMLDVLREWRIDSQFKTSEWMRDHR